MVHVQKENTWVVNGIRKRIFIFGLAKITAEALNTEDLLTNIKGSFFILNQNFHYSWRSKNKSIDISYSYIPEPLTKGLSLNTKLKHHILSIKWRSSRIFRFRYGPEYWVILKINLLTTLVLYFYKFKSGKVFLN